MCSKVNTSEVSGGTLADSQPAHFVSLFDELPHLPNGACISVGVSPRVPPNTSVECCIAIMATNPNEVFEGTLENNQHVP